MLKNKCIFAISEIKTLELSKILKSVIALGTFDGVHLGHQKIIDELLQEAKKTQSIPIVVTFFPHPTHVLTPNNPLKMINSIDERVELLKEKGVDTIVVKEFTKDFSKKSAFDFIQEELLIKLNMQTLVVGYDHSFGKNKEGDYKALKQYGDQLGFNVKRVPVFKKEEVLVSSSLIREFLLKGEIQNVNGYLDYSFCLFGKVVKGNQLGRKIGFQTANIVLDYPNKIVPKTGVYVAKSKIEGENHYGMMNIGFRPTINGTTRTIEVHYFDINTNLYDKKIRVELLYRLRDEFKFDSIEALKNQLKIDKVNALTYIATI